MRTLSYRWMRGVRGDLVGQNAAWLKSACRERGIKVTGLTRAQMIDALLEWEKVV